MEPFTSQLVAAGSCVFLWRLHLGYGNWKDALRGLVPIVAKNTTACLRKCGMFSALRSPKSHRTAAWRGFCAALRLRVPNAAFAYIPRKPEETDLHTVDVL